MSSTRDADRAGEGAALDALRAENAALAARVRALSGALSRAEERFDAFTSTLPGISWEAWGEPYEAPVTYVSASAEAITGYGLSEWDHPGFWLKIMHPDDRARVLGETEESYARGDTGGVQEYRWIARGGGVRWAHVRYTIVRDEAGRPAAWQAFTIDITAQKEAEAERDRMREELIRSQAELLAELSTPLVPVAEDVLAMPLVGRIDRARADRVLSVLLEGVGGAGARVAILDVTGVPSVDAEALRALLRAARATRLLGAEMMITGVRPEVARAICAEGEGLGGVTTCATLRQGIARAMAGGRRPARG
ncbi:MAG: PAS domain-containing protein [Polyangiaceae bacterium]|nr:PAS domain-containing protein [Polyangiaceae bacterium]